MGDPLTGAYSHRQQQAPRAPQISLCHAEQSKGTLLARLPPELLLMIDTQTRLLLKNRGSLKHDYSFKAQFGGHGLYPGKFFGTPKTIAIDRLTSNIYISESVAKQNNSDDASGNMHLFDCHGVFIRSWAILNCHTPSSFVVDLNGNVVVAHHYCQQIWTINEYGHVLSQFGENDQFELLNSVALDEDENILVLLDYQILKFTKGGEFIKTLVHPSNPDFPKGLNALSITVEPNSGLIYALDIYCVQVFFTSDGMWGGQFHHGERWRHILVDGEENTAAINDLNEIHIRSSDEEYLALLTQKDLGLEPKEKFKLVSLALDRSCNLLVVDSHNKLIRVLG